MIDDEPPAIALIEKHISMIDSLEVVGTSHSAVKAYGMLQEANIDLLFLDIRMPVLNGLDFIKSLKTPPAIILTTAYREYALDGYDLDIIDYLLKPIAFKRFLKAVDRYRNRKMAMDAAKTSTSTQVKYIFCNVNRTNHKVVFDDILFIESLKDYVRIHTLEGKLVVKGNLGSFMNQLPDNQFIRIHRSFAINYKHLKSYNQSEVEIAGQKLPIGLSYRDKWNKQ